MQDDDVVLRTAYAWDCPACSTENFARAVEHELDPDEYRALMRHAGVDPDGFEFKQMEADGMTPGVEMVTCPTRVTCSNPQCGKSFAVWIDPETIVPDDLNPNNQ